MLVFLKQIPHCLRRVDSFLALKNINTPLLSVLIPAYEYPLGVTRILDALAENCELPIECIIYDDSTTDSVEQAVHNHPANLKLIYHRNNPSLGAIKNWNYLLNSAQGMFVMLLHHDECPVQYGFFRDLCFSLTSEIDAIVLDCFIFNTKSGRMRRHFPLSLKKLVLQYFPSYLLRRNLIGPPSVLVVRRQKILLFDIRIPWLVDVEWYYRLLSQTQFRVNITKKLLLLSVIRQDSITASFGNTLSIQKIRQSTILLSENLSLKVLKLSAPCNYRDRISGISETICWYFIRFLTRLFAHISSKKIPEYIRRSLRI